MSGNSWAEGQRVLCVRLDSMGDVLMTTPAIRALAESGKEVTLLTSPAGVAIAGMIPDISRVISYEAPWMKTRRSDDPAPDLALIERLRAGRFDAAFIFTLHTQSPLPAAMLCQLAGVPLRSARSRENPYHLLTDWFQEDEANGPFRHDVERQLSLVEARGFIGADLRLQLSVPDEARTEARQLLAELGFGEGERWALLHPGASASSRRYHPERFAEAAGILTREEGWRFLVVGGPAERLLVQCIAKSGGPGIRTLMEPSLPLLAALIGEAPMVICNNSGPAHIAAALQRPVVDLYALTNPQHAPWATPHRLLNHDVPCRNCYKSVCPMGHHDCLRLVTPVQVVQAVRQLWAETHTATEAVEAPAREEAELEASVR